MSNPLRPFHPCFVVRGFDTDKKSHFFKFKLLVETRAQREREMIPPCLLGQSWPKPPAVRSRRKRRRLEETLQKGFWAYQRPDKASTWLEKLESCAGQGMI